VVSLFAPHAASSQNVQSFMDPNLRTRQFIPVSSSLFKCHTYVYFLSLFLQAAKGTMDGIMNTASASMSMYAYLALLKPQGKMILLGLPEKPLQISAFSLVTGKSVS
jgi:hypothetical protein